jgi:hypothetical protein
MIINAHTSIRLIDGKSAHLRTGICPAFEGKIPDYPTDITIEAATRWVAVYAAEYATGSAEASGLPMKVSRLRSKWGGQTHDTMVSSVTVFLATICIGLGDEGYFFGGKNMLSDDGRNESKSSED